jgi:hypothetical protein
MSCECDRLPRIFNVETYPNSLANHVELVDQKNGGCQRIPSESIKQKKRNMPIRQCVIPCNRILSQSCASMRGTHRSDKENIK